MGKNRIVNRTSPKPAPYGSWPSPITSDLIVAQSIGLSEVRFDGGSIYWLEGRPQEQGRLVVVRADWDGGNPTDVTPKPYSARTRVHEYGGGAWAASGGIVYFSNFNDGRLYRQSEAAAPEPLTPAPATRERQWRFADGVIDHRRRRWLGVREDHTAAGEPVNAIVAIDLGQIEPEAGRVLAGGHDFFASPRLSPDGSRLMWLAWDHTNMPWNGTTLYLAALDQAGQAGEPQVIAGRSAESIFQPEWSPDGSAIFFVSDRSNWWNLYAFDVTARTCEPLAPMASEFGWPQWNLGMSSYACAGRDRIVCAYSTAGLGRLGLLDLKSKTLQPGAAIHRVRLGQGRRRPRGVFVPARPIIRAASWRWIWPQDAIASCARRPDLDREEPRIADWLTTVQPVEFPTSGGVTAFGLFYPPRNPGFVGSPGEKPPLLVKCHGGPTGAASSALNLTTQFWTSRGIAVLDVNYGGSTGFGRAYRERLHGNWGIVDVDDCVNGAKFLVAQGWVDAQRIVISGGSAGGYTTLAALVFRDFFQGGASYYGISDVAALARDTHKFESRYLDGLIGPYPQEEQLYRERSPLFHADRLSKPVIFFQGDEDLVVPPSQSEAMVEALRRNGNPVGYFLFAGEQHGFRKAANIQRCLDAELSFYAIEVFKIGLTF